MLLKTVNYYVFAVTDAGFRLLTGKVSKIKRFLQGYISTLANDLITDFSCVETTTNTHRFVERC